MLEINNLHVKLEDEPREILKGLSLNVKAGEVHAIMGPNGSGKSTLSYVLSGRDGYEVTDGQSLSKVKTCWRWMQTPAPQKAYSSPSNTPLKSLA